VGSGVGAKGATKVTDARSVKLQPSMWPKSPPDSARYANAPVCACVWFEHMPSPNESNRVNTYSWWAQISVLTTSAIACPPGKLG